MSRKEYATSWVIDIETSMRRTAGREFSKAIGACNGYEDNFSKIESAEVDSSARTSSSPNWRTGIL
jgi:hypothetical protein